MTRSRREGSAFSTMEVTSLRPCMTVVLDLGV